MRTRVTLDDDVAALLKDRQAERRQTFNEALNDALREALVRRDRGLARLGKYRLRTFSVGNVLVKDLDDVGGLLETLDGPARR